MNIAIECLLLVMIASIGAWLVDGPCLWFLWFVRQTIRIKRAGGGVSASERCDPKPRQPRQCTRIVRWCSSSKAAWLSRTQRFPSILQPIDLGESNFCGGRVCALRGPAA
jgi:hypothetical protein